MNKISIKMQSLTKFFKPKEKPFKEMENPKESLNSEKEMASNREIDHASITLVEALKPTVEICQPVIKFPTTFIGGQYRKFNAEWYARFSWIHHDISSDSAFCGFCRAFNKLSDHNNKSNFIDIGCSDWHNALAKFDKHQKSKSHQDNAILWINKTNVSKPSCASLINSQHQKNVDLNRKNLTKIIKAVHFLAKQGLAFRGHDECSVSNNRGNLQELLEFMCTDDTELSNHIQNKVANYTCADSQNEIISLLAGHVKKKILPKSGDFFSLIADETMDLSKFEQVCVCLRFVEQDLSIHERFYGFFSTKVTTADAIFDLLKRILENLKLDLNLMVGQSYDGAATMSGIKNGVAAKFLKLIKTAVFVHCHAHKLNLALCDASMQIKDVSDIITIVENVSVFIRRSAKRHALFEHIKDDSKKEKLKLFLQQDGSQDTHQLKLL